MLRFSSTKHAADSFFARFVHLRIPPGSSEHARHCRFLAATGFVSGLGLGTVPLLIVGHQSSPGLWAWATAFASVPFLLAVAVSRSGKLNLALNIAALFMASLLGFAIGTSGALVLPFILIAALCCLEPAFWQMNHPVAKGVGMAVIIASTAIILTYLGISVAELRNPASSLSILSWVSAAAYFVLCLHRTATRLSKRNAALSADVENQAIVAASTQDLITVHHRDGSARFVAASCRDMIGVTPDDLSGAGFSGKIHLQDRILFLQGVSDVWHARREQKLRIRLRSKGLNERSWIWVDMTLSAQVSDNGAVSSVVACSRNVTAEVQREQEFERAAQDYERSRAAQKRFLATMSHELRTPLNAIIGFSDVLEQELFGRLEQQRHREYISHIHSSGQHLLNVVNDMLDMSRIEAGRYELDVSEFSLNEVISKTLNMMLPLAEKAKVTIIHDCEAGLPLVLGDRRSWQQILINLLSNAIKFTPEGGTVSLKARSLGRNVKLVVRDTGIGMEPEFLKSIGEPFLQADTGTDRRFGGTGLGLSVVKGLVELSGGELRIDSNPGEGAVAEVSLPQRVPVAQPRPHTEDTQIVSLPESQATADASSKPSSSVTSKGDSDARLSA